MNVHLSLKAVPLDRRVAELAADVAELKRRVRSGGPMARLACVALSKLAEDVAMLHDLVERDETATGRIAQVWLDEFAKAGLLDLDPESSP
jgi:hypothetical protein